MQNVVVIHGGTSFDTHDDYIAFIKNRELTRERLLHGGHDWRFMLSDDLGEGYEVLLPKMPNATNARYAEWSLWFERCLGFVGEEAVFIGHSLGGIFLAKFGAEHSLPGTAKAVVLVAAPYDDVATDETLTDFTLPTSLDGLAQFGDRVHIVHSEDDPVVPFSEAAKYQQALPDAQLLAFKDRQHFNQEHFPELVQLIQSL